MSTGFKGHGGLQVVWGENGLLMESLTAVLTSAIRANSLLTHFFLFFSFPILDFFHYVQVSLTLSLPPLPCLLLLSSEKPRIKGWGLEGGRPAHYGLLVQTAVHTWLHWHSLITWPGDKLYFSVIIRASPGPRLQRAAWVWSLSPHLFIPMGKVLNRQSDDFNCTCVCTYMCVLSLYFIHLEPTPWLHLCPAVCVLLKIAATWFQNSHSTDSISSRCDELHTPTSCTAVCEVLQSFEPMWNSSTSLVCAEFQTCHQHQHGARLSTQAAEWRSLFGSLPSATSSLTFLLFRAITSHIWALSDSSSMMTSPESKTRSFK